MSNLARYLPVAGRVLMGSPFVVTGLNKLAAYDGTVAYIGSVGLPLAPVAWVIAVAVEVIGGAALVLGYRGRPVAFLLALFSLATAVFFHHNFADQSQMIHFLKNLMLAGGLLQIAHFGAGPLSIDAARALPTSTEPAVAG